VEKWWGGWDWVWGRQVGRESEGSSRLARKAVLRRERSS